MLLKDLCEIKTNYPGADFWIIRKGDAKKVGQPVKEFNAEYIGVKVRATDVLEPKYLYYVIMYIHGRGDFERLSKGTLRLKHITSDDIKHIQIS